MSNSVPRIGCVPYLNARPLLEGIGYPITELVPAKLCELFQEGMLDAALLSSIDVLTMVDPSVVDGVSISCRGAVQSVLLAYTGALSQINKVHLDPASHTSNLLVRVILEEFHGLKPDYVQIESDDIHEFPAVVIGDRALALRKNPPVNDLQFLDLGGEWVRHTKLPFVFALWSLRNDLTDKTSLSKRLREARDRGLSSLDQIAKGTEDPEFTRIYLGGSIRYDLGEEEKRGLALFGEYLGKLKTIPDRASKISYY